MKPTLARLARGASRLLRREQASPDTVERAEWNFYLDHVRPGMTVFDVGANVGELSLLFSRFVGPEGRVHCFEPGPDAYERLTTVVKATARDNLVLNRMALSDKSGEVELFLYGDWHSWSSLVERPFAEHGIETPAVSRVSVPSATVDEYCRLKNIGRIDLLKIDVEGAELQVLRGAEQKLRSHSIQRCIFEFGQTTFDVGNHPDQITKFLTDVGYSFNSIVPGQPPFPGRDVSTARFSMILAMPAR